MAFVNLGQVVYPVGSVYISTGSTSPANLFGGSWTRIADAYLRAMGTTGVSIGTYGGYANYTLSIEQMPSHTHGIKDKAGTGWSPTGANGDKLQYANLTRGRGTADFFEIQPRGGGASFPMLPRYVSVYMWRRTA